MTLILKVRNKSTPGSAPAVNDIVAGELALNTADGKLYYKDSAGAISYFGKRPIIYREILVTNIAYAAGTAITIPNSLTYIIGGTTDMNSLKVYRDGFLQVRGASDEYIENTTSTVKFNYDIPIGTEITFEVIKLQA